LKLEQEVNEMDGLGASIFFEGVAEGEAKGKAEVIRKFFSKGLTIDEISEYLERFYPSSTDNAPNRPQSPQRPQLTERCVLSLVYALPIFLSSLRPVL
jgi:hypothetical protein